MAADYVNIDLGPREDGTKWKLRFQHNDIADLEQLTGKSFLDVLSGQHFYGTRLMLAFGLRWMDSKMNQTKAGKLIQDHWLSKGKTLDELADVIKEALEAGHLLKPLKPDVDAEADEGNARPEVATP